MTTPHEPLRSVSVVIPVRTEAGSLRVLLQSLANQTFPPAEIIFVDGGSTDGTVALVRAFADAAGDKRIRVIEAGPATPGRGRNIGIAAARHSWLALTDAGLWVEPRWLEELAAAVARQPDADVVYGNYEPVTETFFTRCAALVYVPPKLPRAGGMLRGPSTASMLLRRQVWERLGGFPDLRAAEDLIFMERVAQQGFTIAWAPQATVWWQLRPSLSSTFRRFVTYSRHNVRAGRQRWWHYGLARQYVIAAVFVLLAFLHDPRWLLVPVAGVLARAARSLWQRRAGNSLWWALNPAQFCGVLLILLTIDLATFVGWGQAIRGSSATPGQEHRR